MVTLKNKRRQMLVFNLDAPFFVKNRNETEWGKPCSTSFLALEEKEVHDAVLSCSEVKAAIAKGDLRVLKTAKEQPSEKKETSAAPSEEGSSKGKSGRKKAARI